MQIKIQKAPRCIWHTDCGDKPGIMKSIAIQDKYSIAECLDCGKRGKIPIGTIFDVCFEAEEVKICTDHYPEHCTDTSHGDCWCEPKQEGNLIIHNQGS